jgi:hypothetical protein
MKEITMNKLRLAFCAALLISVTLTLASLTQAQATRTWVSGVGDDVNPCSRTAPCKTFAGAISKTAKGGEIDPLDSGGFGAVTITKSITIDGIGVLAGILGAGTTGIIIKLTDPADTAKSVRLRGLSLNGVGTGLSGITVLAANNVSIEDCVIDGFTKYGISVEGGGAFVKNTSIRNNTLAGINVTGGGQVAITDSAVTFNGTGLVGAVIQINNVVLYGNKTGDPARK